MRRREFLLAAAGMVVSLASGCGDDNARPTRQPTPTSTALPTPIPVDRVAGYEDPTAWQERTLRVASWGGEYQDAQERAIFEPFQRLTGARIETFTTDLNRLRDQVESSDLEWDVADVLTEDVLPLANIGVLDELDYNVIDADGIFSDMRSQFGVGSSYYSTVLAYRGDAWPGIANPSGWLDFWSVDRYPGNRGLHRDPQTTLEFALLADGVAMSELYPLDTERAFASLDRIRAWLTLWWEQGAQAAQTVTTGDLAMVSAWHSRILTIQDEGAAVGIVWDGGALSGDSWVVLKGTQNRDIAMDFINFATRPEVCAAFSTLVPFGPVHQDTFALLPPTVTSRLPTSPVLKSRQFTIDFEWWFKHREAVDLSFEDWLAEHP